MSHASGWSSFISMKSSSSMWAPSFAGLGTESRIVGMAGAWVSEPGTISALTGALWFWDSREATVGTIGTAVPVGSNIGSRGSMAGSVGRPRPSGAEEGVCLVEGG